MMNILSTKVSEQTKITFAERMMAKMGHIEGKGLGKEGTGIVNPVEASNQVGTAGIGYDTGLSPTDSVSSNQWSCEWEQEPGFVSTVIKITQFPTHTGPSYAFSLFDFEWRSKVKEVMCPKWNPEGMAYVVFHAEDDALEAVHKYDNYHFGLQNQKIGVELVPEDATRTDIEFFTLSEFDEQKNSAICTHTVVITGLPEPKVRSSLNKLLEDYFLDEDSGDYVEAIDTPERGTAMLRFIEPDVAESFVDNLHGTYWKNATIYLKCVPDEEMGELLERQRERKTAWPTGKLFVSNIPECADSEYIQRLFNPTTLHDVSILPKKRCAFVFLAQKDATTFLEGHPDGINFEGRRVHVRPQEKQKGKGRAQCYTPAPAPAVKPQDVKINNLHYDVSKKDVRRLFTGFQVSKVKLLRGYGFVGLGSLEEAKRALQLTGKLVLGRPVNIKMAEKR